MVTGASAGVGAACARTFAELGANLELVARGEVALNAITQELQKKTSVLPVLMDVANIHDCKSLMEKAFNEFAAIHVLINNAGLHRRGEVESRSPQDLVAMVDVNLRAPLQPSARRGRFLPLAQGLVTTWFWWWFIQSPWASWAILYDVSAAAGPPPGSAASMLPIPRPGTRARQAP